MKNTHEQTNTTYDASTRVEASEVNVTSGLDATGSRKTGDHETLSQTHVEASVKPARKVCHATSQSLDDHDTRHVADPAEKVDPQ